MRIIDNLRRRVADRPRREARLDPLSDLSPREWADLPTWHPGNDIPAR